MDNRPIGIFDSGMGGLTVVKEVMARLKNESIIYFGDTARVPYGSKSKETVTKFSAQIIRFLIKQDVKAIIIACNTVNTNSIEELRSMFSDIPIVGVVEPGVHMALQTTRNSKIGIIGTEATISSEKYPKLLHSQNPHLKVYSKACPLFVPLVEEGWVNHEVTRQVVREYLHSLIIHEVDTLILGCTHYPMLADVIQEVAGEAVTLINPAQEAAERVRILLEKTNSAAEEDGSGSYRFYVSDNPSKMKSMVEIFLSYPVECIEKIEIEKY
ncbi:MAG: glutamate racemase [Cellulosilyticaceae bacterium]